MSIYSMSPRSFYGLNRKLTFVQDICRKFMYKLKDLCEQNIDLLDQMFLLESPNFNVKNPFTGVTQLEEFKVISYNAKSLYQL